MYGLGGRGDEDGITRLLDEGVDPAAPEECNWVSGREVFDSVEMTVAVQYGSLTVLHYASHKGHVSLVRLLVERAPQLLEKRDEVRGLSLSLSLSLPVD